MKQCSKWHRIHSRMGPILARFQYDATGRAHHESVTEGRDAHCTPVT